MRIRTVVNNETLDLEISLSNSLLELLRDILGLTGTKKGCDFGGCGMCTVLVEDKPVFSCITPAWRAEGKRITTIEGVGIRDNHHLHPIQAEMLKNFAFQCGYCTPSMVLVAKSLLQENPSPTEQEVKEALSGVICRCTGYSRYVKAVLAAAETMKKGLELDI
ncbi:MAG: (2Fe-2S)-binding protein [Thaumarchaeota archaeon]|nr:(2Fe-2S)-binding protein [Nitrososphaerota archaeon]